MLSARSLRVVVGHPRLLSLAVLPAVLVRVQCVEVPRHQVVGDASQQRAPAPHRVKAGVPLEGARLDVRRLVDLDGVADVVELEVRHARDDVALVSNTVDAQVARGVHQLCKLRVADLVRVKFRGR